MASAFDQLGMAVPETENKNLGFSMSFTDEDLEGGERRSLYRIVTPGDYDFKVYDVEFAQSKKGTDFAKVTLSIEDESGEVRVTDNLFCTTAAKWKIAKFFQSIGMYEELKAKGLDMDRWKAAVDKTGRVTIATRTYTKNNGEQGESNDVKAYIAPAGEKAVR